MYRMRLSVFIFVTKLKSVNALSSFVTVGMPKPIRANKTI